MPFVLTIAVLIYLHKYIWCNFRFERVEAAPVWHNHVTMYSVSDQNGGVPVGYFYLDLVFRPGKYRHISSFSIVPNRWKADGSRQNGMSFTFLFLLIRA